MCLNSELDVYHWRGGRGKVFSVPVGGRDGLNFAE